MCFRVIPHTCFWVSFNVVADSWQCTRRFLSAHVHQWAVPACLAQVSMFDGVLQNSSSCKKARVDVINVSIGKNYWRQHCSTICVVLIWQLRSVWLLHNQLLFLNKVWTLYFWILPQKKALSALCTCNESSSEYPWIVFKAVVMQSVLQKHPFALLSSVSFVVALLLQTWIAAWLHLFLVSWSQSEDALGKNFTS